MGDGKGENGGCKGEEKGEGCWELHIEKRYARCVRDLEREC